VAEAEPFRAVDEPLCLWRSEPEAKGGLREVHLEYTSRGDRVPARLLLPAAPPPPGERRFLILSALGDGGATCRARLDVATRAWVRDGAALLQVDLPLHGERSSPKLSERVAAGMRSGDGATPLERSLWVDFVRQAVADLRRGLDAAATHPEVDGRRPAFAGFHLGAWVGALLCAVDHRIAAAALAGAGSGAGRGPGEVDAAAQVGAIAPRPVLFVNVLRDEAMPRAAAEALHAAAGEPKEVRWLDCDRDDLPDAAGDMMGAFLRRHVAKT
jgi:dienelactone hydrolase